MISQGCLAQTDSIAKQRERASADSTVNAVLQKNRGEKKLLAISTDVWLDIWCERNLTAEFQVSDHVAVGGTFSMMVPNPKFEINVFAPTQYEWPGLIYNGYAERLYVKYYPGKKNNDYKYTYEHPRKIRGYWCFQVDVKQMHYGTHTFFDETGDDFGFYTVASANQNVLDFALFHGHEIILNDYWFIDFFSGLGYRTRWVTQTVTSSDRGSADYIPTPGSNPYGPTGIFKYTKTLPFPEISLRLGFTLPHSIKQIDY